MMKTYNTHINWIFLLMLGMSVLNLLFAHHYFLETIGLEVGGFKSSLIDNLIACLLDTSVLLLITWLLTLRHLRISLTITFIVTLVWSFCNVFYARFFHQYLNWSSIGQAGNLSDTSVINSMLAELAPIDLFFPIMGILFCYIYFHFRQKDVTHKSLRTIGLTWLVCATIGLTAHALYIFHPIYGFVYELEKTMFTPPKMDSMWPNWTVFHKGFFRKMVLEQFTRNHVVKLTKEQVLEIENLYSNHSQRITHRTASDSIQNLIFILVESYLSVTSELIVDGKEITPNLNRLKHDSTVYYNGHMRPNVSIGESADGQFIYMAGLLPLHSEITVSKAKLDSLIGLPKLWRNHFPKLTSMTIIPTNPSLWEQKPMTDAYGFDNLYSIIDYQSEMKDYDNSGFLNDGMIFKYASYKDDSNSQPFFSLILTMSMHQPYDACQEHGFTLTDKNLPQRYKNYLTSCHYTDIQIGKYLDTLKQKGLYDKSLIVIVADHDARTRYLDMEGKVSDDIPIFIINGGFNPKDAWQGECNQLDVYTTILDIMGIDSKWRGLGHTLLNKNYQNSVTSEVQEISDMIIYGNYFATKEDK